MRIAWLGVPLVILTATLIYSPPAGLDSGMVVLWITVPLGVLVVYLATKRDPARLAQSIEAFRKFDIVDEEHRETDSLDAAGKPAKVVKETVLVNAVTAVPSELALLLEEAGGGTPISLLELHRGLAYLAINEADELTTSDHTTVVVKLDQKAPSFTVRPYVPTDQPPTLLVPFKKDPGFASKFIVEGADAKAARAFLSVGMRDALLEMPEIWICCEGKGLALTRFGEFDPEATRRLLDVADLFFAEYGAGGGPSLLEPQGAPVKKAKKHKAKPVAARAST